MNTKLWKAVAKRFIASDIEGAIRYLEALLAKEKSDQFKKTLGLQFSNSPQSVLSEINRFIRHCDKSFDLQAVYLEMNGFDINYDRWYFDLFGYDSYKDDPDDIDWLSRWRSEDWRQTTLKGLGAVQKEFQRYDEKEIWKDKKHEKAHELTVLLVMAKFVFLIQSALGSGELAKPVPVLATAHDFDIIGRFAA
jgi:hypothetical protein